MRIVLLWEKVSKKESCWREREEEESNILLVGNWYGYVGVVDYVVML